MLLFHFAVHSITVSIYCICMYTVMYNVTSCSVHYGASVVHVTCTVKIVIGQTSRTSTTVIGLNGLTSNTCMHAWIWDECVHAKSLHQLYQMQ